MSGFLTRFFTAVGLLKKKANVLVVGLDNSGKSTIVHWLKPQQPLSPGGTNPSVREIIPTVGFTVEQFDRQKIAFTVFDMSGQGRYRNLWEHYYPDAEAIIYVVDAADRTRMSMAREELDGLRQHKSIQSRPVPILFLANKMDKEGALSAAECSDVLGLDQIRNHAWTIAYLYSRDGLFTMDSGTIWVDPVMR